MSAIKGAGVDVLAEPIVFVIPLPWTLPTANHRLHWAARAKLVAKVRETVRLQAARQRIALGIPENVSEPRSVRLTLLRGYRQRMLDLDGAFAAAKPVLDSPVDAGWLPDDAPRWLLDYRVSQQKDNTRGPAVVVEIGMPT